MAAVGFGVATLPVAVAGQGSYLWTQPRAVPEAAAPAPGGSAMVSTSSEGEGGKSEPADEAATPAQEEPAPAQDKAGIDSDLDDE